MAVRRSVMLWTMVLWTAYSLLTFADVPNLRTRVPNLGTSDWVATADKALKSILMIGIQVDEHLYVCTGFVIDAAAPDDRDRILTAAHCDQGNLYVDGVSPRILFKDARADLMVLDVPDTDRPALRLAAKDPRVMDDVLSCGFGGGLEKPVARLAHVSAVNVALPKQTGTYILTDAPFVPGMSGGPVLNAAGEVAMIVQLGDGREGAGRGVELLRSRIGKYTEKISPPHK